MPSFTNLLVVMAVAFAAPLLLGLFPRLLLPSVVLEIVAGIVVGPSVLGWVEVDQAVEVIALLGLAFVLFLAGLEIEFEKLRGPLLRAHRPRLRAVVRDRARRLVRAEGGRPRRHAAARRDHPLRHLARGARPGAQGLRRDRLHLRPADHRRRLDRRLRGDHPAHDLLLRRGRHRVDAAAARRALRARRRSILAVVRGAEHSMRIREDLLRLQDTTAQIRVRAALVLFVGFAALAEPARARGDPRRLHRRRASSRSSTATR